MSDQTDNPDTPQKRLSGAQRRFVLAYSYHFVDRALNALTPVSKTFRGKLSNPTTLPKRFVRYKGITSAELIAKNGARIPLPVKRVAFED